MSKCAHCGFEIATKMHNCCEVAEMKRKDLEKVINEMREWSEEDDPIPEDKSIHDAHPLRTKDFDTYMEALRMVSAKKSKYALVDLVNWLLVRIKNNPEGK